ncbi:hypothetical protein [Geobacter benzoatilyticus]|uniref:Uncharacterized protein n=1 Tax=Geobacter benzoatilyticus TaxID=2815309 RepID=A0ABX7Q0S0_9BACT|nr:hypothetical protein [Geobacter benzoatilyticus]QSV44998.1 hypothetical protein JZM60_12680 [Geobacter benzoatilyticus]
MLCIAITISTPAARIAIPRTTVHVVNGDDLQPRQRVMFKPNGAPRKRRGTVIGRDASGNWQIEGARQAHTFAPERFTLTREQIWTSEEHEAQKRQAKGTREATSSHGRTLTTDESNRRAIRGYRALGIAEDQIMSNPRILENARAALAAVASRNKNLSPAFTVSGGTLRNDDPEAMALYSEYVTAAITNLRGLTATAPREDLDAFRTYLAGEDVASRIAYNILRSGRTAAIRYLRRQHDEQARDQEYITTAEDDNLSGMRRVASTVAHSPYHESDLARKIAMEHAIEKQLHKVDPFAADLIRRKFALGDYDQEQSNEQIARELGGTWNRMKVGTAVKDALLKFARTEGTEALRGFLKNVKDWTTTKGGE